jgi:hypothetical protein
MVGEQWCGRDAQTGLITLIVMIAGHEEAA